MHTAAKLHYFVLFHLIMFETSLSVKYIMKTFADIGYAIELSVLYKNQTNLF